MRRSADAGPQLRRGLADELRGAPGSSGPSRAASSAYVSPVRSCTTPSCRSPAIRRRSTCGGVDRALQQPLPVALLALQPAGQRPGERDLHQLEREQPGQRGRRVLAPLRLGGGDHGVVAEVGLEEQRSPLADGEPDVDLEQLAERALVDVLRRGEVADLGVGPALARAPPSSSSPSGNV